MTKFGDKLHPIISPFLAQSWSGTMGNLCACLKPDQESEMRTFRVHSSKFKTTNSQPNHTAPTHHKASHKASTHHKASTTTHHEDSPVDTTPTNHKAPISLGQDDTSTLKGQPAPDADHEATHWATNTHTSSDSGNNPPTTPTKHYQPIILTRSTSDSLSHSTSDSTSDSSSGDYETNFGIQHDVNLKGDHENNFDEDDGFFLIEFGTNIPGDVAGARKLRTICVM
jgi:hypothetical protein